MLKILISFFLFVALLFPSPINAATLPYTITTGIPGQSTTKGATFLTVNFSINYQSGQMIYSGNPDGTGNTSVDDAAIIWVVERPDGTSASTTIRYDNNCTFISSFPPRDVTSFFQVGINQVQVRLYDICGTVISSSSLYLVNTNAPDPTPTPTPTPEPKTPLILIPGIGGSELKVAENTIWNKDDGHGGEYSRAYTQDEVIWLNEPEARAAGEDDYFDILRMQTDGVNSEANINLTNNFISPYQEFVNFFTANGYILNQNLFVFPYDWRKDISTTASLLDQKIQTINQQTANQKVDIVAHSMGGLVARNYISDSQRAQNVKRLITLGTPHLGAVESLKTIIHGGCLTTLTSLAQFICLGISPSEVKDVFQNMISGFELAPSQSYFNFYTGEDNQHPYPYKTETGTLNYSQIKNFLAINSHNTSLFTPSEIFHNIDNSLSNTNGVDVTVIAGSGKSTLGQIVEQKTTSLLGIHGIHKDIININGDNTVPLFSASLNDSAKNRSLLGSAKVYYTNQEHGQLVSDGPTLNLVKNILNEDTTIPTGVSSQPYSFKGTSFSVHSPVNIHVYDANHNHTGPTSEGFEANIPGSSYDSLDDAKFIFLPEDGIYNINFEATDNGSFDFKIRKFENDINSETILYKNIPIISSSEGQTVFDTNSPEPPDLLIDQQTITPDATLAGDANYDLTPPAININTPANNQSLILNQQTTANFQCLDESSGVDKCIGSTDLGENLDTASVGNKSFRVYTEDKAGNSKDLINNFKVQYLSSGLCLNQDGHSVLQPINTDGTSVFKQGSTIPVKFRVCDNNGASISNSGVVTGFSLIQTVSGTLVSTINEPVLSTTPESNFRWDTTNQQWIFNMSTKNLSAGETYSYKISLNDGTNIEFSFGLR